MPIYYNIIQWKYLKTTLILSITQIKQARKFRNSCFSSIGKTSGLKTDLKLSKWKFDVISTIHLKKKQLIVKNRYNMK